MSYVCSFCDSSFTAKRNLSKHQNSTKYCLEKQKEVGIQTKEEIFKCNCGDIFHTKYNFSRHQKTCHRIREEEPCKYNSDIPAEGKNETCPIENVNPVVPELLINEGNSTRSHIKLIQTDNSEIMQMNRQLSTGEHLLVPMRKDGYTDVTVLCKSANKRLSRWKDNKESQVLLARYSSLTGILLGNEKSVQKIDSIWKEKCNQLENNLTEQKLIIEQKDKQMVKLRATRPKQKRTRPTFPKGFFMYIIATRLLLSDKEIKIGKTDNLRQLFSTYNRLSKSVILYYRDCGNSVNMDSCEIVIFNHLDSYRREQNGERFILKDKELSFFISTIDSVINFVTVSEDEGIQNLDMIQELSVEDDFDIENEETVMVVNDKRFIKQVDKHVQELSVENLGFKNENEKLVEKNSQLEHELSNLRSNMKTQKKELDMLIVQMEKYSILEKKN